MEIVKSIKDLKNINSYVPTKRQMTLHNSKSRHNLFGGSMGCGKSVAMQTVESPNFFLKNKYYLREKKKKEWEIWKKLKL